MEDIVKAEKEYLANVLHKKLIDSDERVFGRDDYNKLARKYWPEEFEKAKKNNYKVFVHHIDFDHSNNVVSNLVVLTCSEHMKIHALFDPKAILRAKNISSKMKGTHMNAGNRWMTNGSEMKFVSYDKVNLYIQEGYWFGRNDNKRWMTNGVITKQVSQSEIEMFIEKGYWIGRI